MMKMICKGLAMDPKTRRVLVDGHVENLSEGEFYIFSTLASYPGDPVLFTKLSDRALKQVIYRLRLRIGPKWVESIRGRGYRLGV